jgi:phosphotransferase system enzyme I (PtsP)
VERARASNTELSYCGEDAGRPIDAICFAALGIKNLSMRPASIAPVKYLIRRVDLKDVKFVIDQSRNEGHESVRTSVINWVKKNT